MITIFLLALAGSVLAAVVGTLWYMPHTPTGKVHMQYLGFDTLSPEEQAKKIEAAKPTMPKIYAAQFLLSFLTALAVVFIIIMSIQNGVAFSTALLFIAANWLCFMVPVVGSNILWGNCDPKIAWKKFFTDIGANLVTVLLIAVMASFFV